MAEDSKKPYGDVEYADPGYQSDKKKRYPVDTEAHARAAWSYINQADNASAYSSDDLAKVKAKIKAACKKFGIEISSADDPPPPDSTPIECRVSVQQSPTDKNEILFLPVGIHAITPVAGGIGKAIQVLVNAETAFEIEAQREEISARKRVYFDFNHEDGPASFWPSSFVWRASEGVVAKGEWTDSGKRAVQGKDFRAFSPVFHVDDKRAEPARVVCCEGARPNMGGLVNDPAFSDLPLWAKNAGDASPAPELKAKETKPKEKNTMTDEEIAALRAKNKELEQKKEQLEAIIAGNDNDATSKAQLEAIEAENRAVLAEIQAGELKRENDRQKEIILKRAAADADVVIRNGIKSGQIPAKNLRLQSELKAKMISDPTFSKMFADLWKNANGPRDRVVPPPYGDIQIVNEDPLAVYAKIARVLQDTGRASTHEQKARYAAEMGAIYAAEFRDSESNRDRRNRLVNSRLDVIRDAIMASDVTDTNLGTIAGTLVTQRTLELLKLVFPPLARFTTDFSDQPATFNQTVMTRIVTIPTVVAYSTATGWVDQVAATTDVPVVINNHKGIPITFNEQLLASTMRRLFDEFAEASAYALAKAIVDSIYANLTDANFTNNTIVASSAFVRSNVVDIGVALTQRGVPLGMGSRTMILWPVAFGNLVKDTTIIQPIAYKDIGIITQPTMPNASFMLPVDTFEVFTAPNLPSNNANLVGFAGSRSALCIATRVPNDYTSILPGASFGNVQMVTDPDIGITVMQVQYVNHTLGTATNRIAMMWGAAAGQTAAGQLVKAAAGTGSAR